MDGSDADPQRRSDDDTDDDLAIQPFDSFTLLFHSPAIDLELSIERPRR